MTLTSSFQKIAETLLGNSGYGNVYIRTYARVSSSGPDIENNRTLIYVQARIYTEGGYWYSSSGTTYRITASGSLDSGTVSCNGQYEVGETVLGTISGYVNHNDDGTRTIHAESNFTSTPWGWNATASASNISLPTIPRASTVSCSSPYIGDTAIITVGKKAASFTSTVTYKIGTLTGTIAEKTTETVLSLETEALKEQIYALIPNAKSTRGTITCTTYSGNTQIGSPTTATFNLYAVEEDCKPIVRGIVVDTNESTIALTGDSSKLIKYISKPKVTITATPNNSATIKSYSINLNDGQTSSEQEEIFETISSNNITVNATDSREYDNPQTITSEMIDYIKLHIDSIKLSRTEDISNEIILNANGVWFNEKFNDNTSNTLSVSFQYKKSGDAEWIDGGTITPTIDGNTFKFTDVSLGNIYNFDDEYQFKIIVTDLLMIVGNLDKETQTVEKGQEVVAIGEDTVWVYGDLLLNDKSIKEKNIITVKLSSNQSETTTSQYNIKNILFDSVYSSIGDKLTLSNNGIKIGSGISKVKVSATVAFNSTSTDSIGLDLKLNDVEKVLSLTLPTRDDYYTLNLSDIIMDVSENDLINLGVYIAGATTINIRGKNYMNYTISTYMTVEAIE